MALSQTSIYNLIKKNGKQVTLTYVDSATSVTVYGVKYPGLGQLFYTDINTPSDDMRFIIQAISITAPQVGDQITDGSVEYRIIKVILYEFKGIILAFDLVVKE